MTDEPTETRWVCVARATPEAGRGTWFEVRADCWHNAAVKAILIYGATPGALIDVNPHEDDEFDVQAMPDGTVGGTVRADDRAFSRRIHLILDTADL